MFPGLPGSLPALSFPRLPLGSLFPLSCALPAAFPHLRFTSAVPVPGRSDEDPSRRPSPTGQPRAQGHCSNSIRLPPYLPHSFYFTAFIFWGTLCRTKPSLLCSASARAALLPPSQPLLHLSARSIPRKAAQVHLDRLPSPVPYRCAGAVPGSGSCWRQEGRPAPQHRVSLGRRRGFICPRVLAAGTVRVRVPEDFAAPPPSSQSIPVPGETDPKAAAPAALRRGIGTGKCRVRNFSRPRAAEPAA